VEGVRYHFGGDEHGIVQLRNPSKKIELGDRLISKNTIDKLRRRISKKYKITFEEARYFVFTDTIGNSAYDKHSDKINILYKDGSLADIAVASDQLNISVLSKRVEKHFLCHPKSM